MTSPMHPSRAFLIAVLAVLLAACGGATPSSAAPTDSAATSDGGVAEDLCAIVPRELAEAAMGGPVDEGDGGELFPEGSYCVFATDDAAVRVEVQMVEIARSQFDENAETVGLTTTAPGAAEAAYLRETSVQGVTGTWLYAFSGGRSITVDVQGPDDQAAQLEAMHDIVAAVLAGG